MLTRLIFSLFIKLSLTNFTSLWAHQVDTVLNRFRNQDRLIGRYQPYISKIKLHNYTKFSSLPFLETLIMYFSYQEVQASVPNLV